MIWFIGVTLILLGYVVVYWKRGVTHPVPITWAYWIVSLPGIYFLVRGVGIPFAFMSRSEPTPISQIDQAGLYLFCFLCVIVLSHLFFSKVRIGFPVVEAIPRVSFVSLSVLLIGALITAYVIVNGPGALLTSVKLRAFVSTGVGAYFELILEAAILVAVVQASEGRSKLFAAGFLVFIFLYSVLLGRTGLIIVTATAFLGYLCMVYRRVPLRTLIIGSTILIPLALAQGVLRLRGQLSASNIEWLFQQMQSSTAWNFVVQALANRVNQLESFAVLSGKLRDGSLPNDPLDPIYVFAQVVPRSVWPDKPKMFTDQVTTFLAPRVHEAGTVFNFVGPSELMYAYGIIAGIILTGILYGYLFSVFDLYYRACPNRPAAYIFFAVLIYMPFGSATQAGFFNGMTVMMLAVNGLILSLLCRFRIVPRGEYLSEKAS